MQWSRLTTTLCTIATVAATAASAQDLTLGGQVRPRFELRDPVAGEADAFTSMRTRANLLAALEDGISIFVQVQDVRLWGEEGNTLTDFSADNFDLHQGWVEIRSSTATVFSARAGRQETNFGGQRLVGAVGWTQQGRSFDGLRLGAAGDFGTVTVVAYKLNEASTPSFSEDSELVGAYAVLNRVAGGTLDVYGLYDRVSGTPKTSRATLGARLNGRQSDIVYRLEGSYQLGKANDLDVSAFMFGARVGTNIGDASITAWYDFLSGDDDPTDGDTKVFNTLFATNHKFYGFADLFLNIPAHTGGFGLQDFAIKGSVRPIDPVRLAVDVHHFRAAKTGTLSSGRFGEEIDLTAAYTHTRNFTVSGGAAYVVQGPAWSDIGRLTENMVWVYLMLDGRF